MMTLTGSRSSAQHAMKCDMSLLAILGFTEQDDLLNAPWKDDLSVRLEELFLAQVIAENELLYVAGEWLIEQVPSLGLVSDKTTPTPAVVTNWCNSLVGLGCIQQDIGPSLQAALATRNIGKAQRRAERQWSIAMTLVNVTYAAKLSYQVRKKRMFYFEARKVWQSRVSDIVDTRDSEDRTKATTSAHEIGQIPSPWLYSFPSRPLTVMDLGTLFSSRISEMPPSSMATVDLNNPPSARISHPPPSLQTARDLSTVSSSRLSQPPSLSLATMNLNNLPNPRNTHPPRSLQTAVDLRNNPASFSLQAKPQHNTAALQPVSSDTKKAKKKDELDSKSETNHTCSRCGKKGHACANCPTMPNSVFDRPPPYKYICHLCGIMGQHFIQRCPKSPSPDSWLMKSASSGQPASTGEKKTAAALKKAVNVGFGSDTSTTAQAGAHNLVPGCGPLKSGSNTTPLGPLKRRRELDEGEIEELAPKASRNKTRDTSESIIFSDGRRPIEGGGPTNTGSNSLPLGAPNKMESRGPQLQVSSPATGRHEAERDHCYRAHSRSHSRGRREDTQIQPECYGIWSPCRHSSPPPLYPETLCYSDRESEHGSQSSPGASRSHTGNFHSDRLEVLRNAWGIGEPKSQTRRLSIPKTTSNEGRLSPCDFTRLDARECGEALDGLEGQPDPRTSITPRQSPAIVVPENISEAVVRKANAAADDFLERLGQELCRMQSGDAALNGGIAPTTILQPFPHPQMAMNALQTALPSIEEPVLGSAMSRVEHHEAVLPDITGHRGHVVRCSWPSEVKTRHASATATPIKTQGDVENIENIDPQLQNVSHGQISQCSIVSQHTAPACMLEREHGHSLESFPANEAKEGMEIKAEPEATP